MAEIINVSLDGSNLTREYVDEKAKEMGFKDGGSKFVQYCIEKTIHGKKLEQRHLIEIILLCLVTMTFLLLLIIFMRG